MLISCCLGGILIEIITVGAFGNVFSLPCLCVVISLWVLIRSAAHVEQQAGHIHNTFISAVLAFTCSWRLQLKKHSVHCFSQLDISLLFSYEHDFELITWFRISAVEVSDPWAVKQSNVQSNIFSSTVYDYFFSSTTSSKSLFWEFYFIGNNICCDLCHILGKVVTFQHIGSDKVIRKERLVVISQQMFVHMQRFGLWNDKTQA